jgi:hypothetical protein
MTPEFGPETTHVYLPEVPEQLKVLEALADAVPACADIDTTLAAG